MIQLENNVRKYIAVYEDGTQIPVHFWEPNKPHSCLNGFGLVDGLMRNLEHEEFMRYEEVLQ